MEAVGISIFSEEVKPGATRCCQSLTSCPILPSWLSLGWDLQSISELVGSWSTGRAGQEHSVCYTSKPSPYVPAPPRCPPWVPGCQSISCPKPARQDGECSSLGQGQSQCTVVFTTGPLLDTWLPAAVSDGGGPAAAPVAHQLPSLLRWR